MIRKEIAQTVGRPLMMYMYHIYTLSILQTHQLADWELMAGLTDNIEHLPLTTTRSVRPTRVSHSPCCKYLIHMLEHPSDALLDREHERAFSGVHRSRHRTGYEDAAVSLAPLLDNSSREGQRTVDSYDLDALPIGEKACSRRPYQTSNENRTEREDPL